MGRKREEPPKSVLLGEGRKRKEERDERRNGFLGDACVSVCLWLFHYDLLPSLSVRLLA